jgi:two-component system cell cycle response regulator
MRAVHSSPTWSLLSSLYMLIDEVSLVRGLYSLRTRYAVGTAGSLYLFWRIAAEPDSAVGFLKPEYLVLVLLYAVLEYAGMYVRSGVIVSFSLAAVMAAAIIGGEVPALLVGLGSLIVAKLKSLPALTAFSNAGVHWLSVAAASTAAAACGGWPSALGQADGGKGIAVFSLAYTVAGSLIVGSLSLLSASRSTLRDQMYNLGFHAAHTVIATSIGTFAGTMYAYWGAGAFVVSCATVSELASLVSQSTRVSISQGGLFNLYEAVSSINEVLTVNEVFTRAKEFARSVVDIDFAWLTIELQDGENSCTEWIWADEGVDAELARGHVKSFSATERNEIAEGFEVLQSSRRPERGYLGTMVSMPLRFGREPFGEFGFAFLESGVHIPRATAQIFAVLSSHLALAVDNAVKFERATELAHTDPLTGLYNYRYFHHLLEEAVSRAAKTGAPVSLIYIDLDHFRDINNTYGHQAGDEALKRIARLVRDSCRDKALVSRPGGDEFTVILPGIGKEQARIIARRIRDNLKSAKLDVRLEEPLIGVVGASVGVAAYPEDGSDIRELIHRADMDMYAAKSEGGPNSRY